MPADAIFTCLMEKLPRGKGVAKAAEWEPYHVVRQFIDGESDILSEGCYYSCRSSIDRYYRYLSRQESLYAVYWINETSFEVHENRLSNCA